MNTSKLLAVGLIVLSVLWPRNGEAQQREYYERAAKLYREAAQKTKCPERARYLNAMAAYQDCVAAQLGGRTAPCQPPAGDTPPCSGDMVGGGGATGGATTNAATAASSNKASVPSLIGAGDPTQAALTAAYENAVNSGRKESGAMLEGFLAAAQQTGDQQLANAYVGTGLALGGIMALAERGAAKKAAEEERIRQAELEAERRRQGAALIASKNEFLQFVEKQGFGTSFSSGERNAIIVWRPASLTAEAQDVYISNLIPVAPDADGSFPMKEKLYRELIKNAPENLRNSEYSYSIIYPVAATQDTDTKISFFSEKGRDLNLNIQTVAIRAGKPGVPAASQPASKQVDFWGNPIKKENATAPQAKQQTNDFWNH